SVSDRGVIELLGMPYLYNKKVKLIVIPEERTTTLEQRRQAAERIMKLRETITKEHWTDEQRDNARYEYLKAKHQ
ncbi:MAG: hypothetical protein FWH18_12500, partial [Marinilabiliaceae bacterium]|nr:hypothetical protein [Marinilabiliaceae bacterium]